MDIEGPFIPMGDAPTRFLKNEASCCAVPGAEFHFEKSFESAGCGIGEIDGGGTETADGNAEFNDVDKVVDAMKWVFYEIVWKSGCQNGVVNMGDARNMDLFSVEESAFANFCNKQFVCHRLINNAADDFSVFFDCNADRKNGNLMGEVDCSVERIDDPEKFTFASSAALFGEKMGVGNLGFDKVDDRFFTFVIVFCNEVVSSFFAGNIEMSAEPAAEDFSGEQSGLNSR